MADGLLRDLPPENARSPFDRRSIAYPVTPHYEPITTMQLGKRWFERLESRWVAPSYRGGLLLGLAIFFFIAATNTLSGWLYVMSGVICALVMIAIVLVRRNLKNIEIHRRAIEPVTAGYELTIELEIRNQSGQAKSLIQIDDRLPSGLGLRTRRVIETLPAHHTQLLRYTHPTQQRGIYRWQTVAFHTAAPLGLFWRSRSQHCPAVAIVHPPVLPLSTCPLLDRLGQDLSLQLNSDRRVQNATEGMTRTLRPYRWGDPIRLIHWRTSARFGELRVRELELLTAGQEVVIALDSAHPWPQEDFEQAVITAASLYFYGRHQQLQTELWTARTGLVRGDRSVLDTLAGSDPNELVYAEELPDRPLIWLTANPQSLVSLSPGSRWILWSPVTSLPRPLPCPGIHMQMDTSLQQQLQSSPSL